MANFGEIAAGCRGKGRLQLRQERPEKPNSHRDDLRSLEGIRPSRSLDEG